MNATTNKAAESINETIDAVEEHAEVLARKAKIANVKKHGITAAKVLGLIGLGVVGTIGYGKIRTRNDNQGQGHTTITLADAPQQ